MKNPRKFSTMEDAYEVRSDHNGTLPEKSKKRKFKTPAQVEALEKLFSEHKYPSEEMKSEIAGSLGLTEKQVSGWLCHRRLKDNNSRGSEAPANGRQDRSSGIVQDHVSGHRQDSCSSTKQGDNRFFDPKEVESRRLPGQDYSAANLAYEYGHHHNRDHSDTSSGSSLPLLHRVQQTGDPFDMATSRYLPQNDNTVPMNSMGIRTRSGPAGYLKLKVPVENAAITAVKRQLGRHYREDGPPLGVEFDSLPPGAFESSIKDPVNEPCYTGDPDLRQSPDFPRICNQPNSSMRYEVYKTKMNSPDSDFGGSSFKNMHGFNQHDNGFIQQTKPKPLLPKHSNRFPGRNSSIEMDEGSTGEIPVSDSTRLCKTRAKHELAGQRMDSSSHHPRPYGHQITGGQREPWSCNSYDVSPEDAHREHFESKYSNITLKPRESLDMEDRQLSRRMAKEDNFYGERRAINEHCNSARVMVHQTNERVVNAANGNWNEFPHRQCAREASMAERRPWSNPVKRAAVDTPSNFSKDETAQTSSSVD